MNRPIVFYSQGHITVVAAIIFTIEFNIDIRHFPSLWGFRATHNFIQLTC